MATYQFSALSDGQAISFNPTADVLNFDQSAIAAADIRVSASGTSTRIDVIAGPNAGKDITLLNTTPFQLATSNVTFVNGSRLLFGDNSTATGDDNGNTLSGGTGRDLIFAFGGSDTINVGTANHGNDFVDGGSGYDTLNFNGYVTTGLVVDFATGTATGSGGTVTFANIERFAGGSGNDIINGNAAAQNIGAVAGNDTIWGAGGNDTLFSGLGTDTFVFRETGTANADLMGDFASGTDKILLDAKVMTALGASGNFAAGDARFWAAAGATGGHDGDDRIIYNTTTRQLFYDADGSGSAAAQLIATLQSGATLMATDIAVEGGASPGGQTINGTSADESLSGGTGNDTINGGGGLDTLTGGAGADRFILAETPRGTNYDYITDFAPGTDKLVLDNSALVNLGIAGDFSPNDPRFRVLDASNNYSAQDADDRVLYYRAGTYGAVYYDPDGNGVAPMRAIASLSGDPNLSASDITVIGNGNPPPPQGTSGNDSLVGSANPDTLDGGAGNDTIEGWDGEDLLIGGDGADVLDGGLNADRVLGGAGNDTLTSDRDYYEESTEVDTLDGGLGNDTYVLSRAYGDFYNEEFVVNNLSLQDAGGIDTIVADSGAWLLGPGFENLVLHNFYGEGAAWGVGNELANVMTGDSSYYTSVVLDGGDGNDTLIGGDGRDWFSFKAGTGNIGNDSVVGGGDEDGLSFYGARSAVHVDMRTGTATGGGLNGSGSVTFSSIDYVQGSSFNDVLIAQDEAIQTRYAEPNFGPTLHGDAGNDTLLGGAVIDWLHGDAGADEIRGGGEGDRIYGGPGNDRLFGDAGDDFIYLELQWLNDEVVGSGNDTIDGGSGVDTIYHIQSASAVVVDFAAGTIIGGEADGSGEIRFSAIENFYGTSGNDRIRGDGGANELDGRGGNDTIFGGGGDDFVYADKFGGGGAAALFGEEGNDVVGGGFGDDVIDGGVGNDLLSGSDGNDTLTGGLGQDTLSGDWSRDNFVFNVAPGSANADLIQDFISGTDKIRLDKQAMTALGATGNFGANDGRFYAAAGATGGHDADDRVVYNTSTGQLFYDADGNGGGAAQLIATLQSASPLAASDIAVHDGALPSGTHIEGTFNNDTLNGGPGDETIDGYWGNDYLTGGGGNDLLDGGNDHDSFFPGTGNDTMLGGFGFDTFYMLRAAPGSYGSDVVDGGPDRDTLSFDSSYATTGIVADLAAGTLSGGTSTSTDGATIASIEVVVGTGFADRMTGGAGNDHFIGLAGGDTLVGGAGYDTLEGGSGSDLLVGGDGNDTLFGGSGNDTFDGGLGDDYYEVTDGDTILSDAGGQDWVIARGTSWFLGADLERLSMSADGTTVTLFATGNSLDNYISGDPSGGSFVLSGLDGNDQLSGGGGNDTLLGGSGNDTLGSSPGDDVLDGGFGNDALYASQARSTLAFTVTPGAANADQILLFDSVNDDIQLDGNAMTAIGSSGRWTSSDGRFYAAPGATSGHDGDDRLVYNTSNGQLFYDADGNGAGAAQLIATLQGAPTLSAADIVAINGTSASGLLINGTSNADSLVGGGGNDTINGLAGNDTLRGLDGDDSLDGGDGVDSLDGGLGNDTYVVTAGDVIVADPGGVDTVRTAVSWNISSANIENVTAIGTSNVSVEGNNLANTIIGNDAPNYINARAGSDSLIGNGGNDTFNMSRGGTASFGNDWIDGGAGVDTVEFGVNAITGLVVDLAAGNMTGGEAGGAGSSTILNIERFIAGDFNDVVTGSAFANYIDARAGNDTVTGAAGNDTLIGGTGNDRLAGGIGVDSMTGGAGLDSFVFGEAPGSANADRITDFVSASDKVLLDDAFHASIGALGNFAAGDGRFWAAAGATNGHDANDRVIYNTSTGSLYYDADGSGAGAAQLIATFTGNPAVAATDIMVI